MKVGEIMVTINFKGKSIVQNYHLSVKYHQLVPVKEKSLTKKVSLNDNLIIHGDNLKALKALLPTYAGKIKCIYIDPPYNTGNEKWAYNDNVNSPMMKDWLGKVVDKDDLTRHDKWLCMMMPRLKLLRELLSEDGAIFVSIDANEQPRLQLLMDEVFSETCYKNTISVRRGIKNVQSQFDTIEKLSLGHEYIIFYTKTPIRLNKLSHTLIEAEAGKWDTFWRGTDRSTMRYELFGQTPKEGQWRWEKNRTKKAIENYKRYLDDFSDSFTLDEFFVDHYTTTNKKMDFVRLSEDDVVQYYVAPRSYKLISDNWMDLTLGGKITDFETEKHLDVVKRCISWITSNDKEAIILDSFAGSGTTGHATLELNKEDEGSRKFILIECEDYADRITADRIRNVIKGVPEAKNVQMRDGLGGSFSYFELGDPIEMESILEGDKLPSFEELARYVFYTATGDEFDSSKVDEDTNYIGESRDYQVYLFYKPDLEYLKSTALTLERAKALKPFSGKKRLVFAPAKFLDLSDAWFEGN
jgi:adenine specific DNA methylase Mod